VRNLLHRYASLGHALYNARLKQVPMELGMPQPRSMRLVINGKAAADPALRAAVATIRKAGTPVEVCVTWESGDASRFAKGAAERGVEVVVAAGGDGTVSEVVDGLVRAGTDHATSAAVVPFGTANDFATACGIPRGDPLAALQLAAAGSARPIDVGQANDRYFVNVASGGFGAKVTAETPPQMKKVLGGAAYSLMGLVTAAKMTPYRGKLITPEEEQHGSMILMAVGNGRLAGGGYPVAPRAMLDDHLLDVMIVVDVEPRDFGVLLGELMNLGDSNNRFAIYRQLEAFRIESESPLHMNLDGEPVAETAFDFRALPRRIRSILPDECPLVGAL
jgi:lipid kinase YegS